MRRLFLLLLLIFSACSTNDEQAQQKQDAEDIRQLIETFHDGLRRAFRGEAVDTEKLFDALFEESVYYVTYWGVTEPLDSTKARLERAIPLISDYASRLEIVSVDVSGDFAYAFFILRQSYRLNGQRDEYLPTTYVFRRTEQGWKVVHAHRSADQETIANLLTATGAVVTADTLAQQSNN